MTITRISCLLCVALLAWSTGCQTTPHRPTSHHAAKAKPPQPTTPSVAAKPIAKASAERPVAQPSVPTPPAEHALATAEGFERKREQAEYSSALARWEEGDSQGCRAVLTSLVKRQPEHRDANLLFAELCLLEDTPADGLPCAERVCRHDPADAQAQHVRGLLLEAMGRHDEALDAYQVAVKHAPQDDIYVASLEAASSRPAPRGVFVAGNRSSLHSDDDVTLIAPRPVDDDVRLTTLRRDVPGSQAATASDE